MGPQDYDSDGDEDDKDDGDVVDDVDDDDEFLDRGGGHSWGKTTNEACDCVPVPSMNLHTLRCVQV